MIYKNCLQDENRDKVSSEECIAKYQSSVDLVNQEIENKLGELAF